MTWLWKAGVIGVTVALALSIAYAVVYTAQLALTHPVALTLTLATGILYLLYTRKL